MIIFHYSSPRSSLIWFSYIHKFIIQKNFMAYTPGEEGGEGGGDSAYESGGGACRLA